MPLNLVIAQPAPAEDGLEVIHKARTLLTPRGHNLSKPVSLNTNTVIGATRIANAIVHAFAD